MHKADINSFSKKLDEIKAVSTKAVHNIFLNSCSLEKIMHEKDCLLFMYEKSLFFLIPRHDQFYDVLFCSTSENELKKDIPRFLSDYDGALDLRASIIGKDDISSNMANLFAGHGFVLGQKLARMRNSPPSEKLKAIIAEFVQERKYEVEYAKPGDENEVLSLLKTEFDARSDNLPEVNEILENIKLNQVLVVRDNGKIILAHYFETRNSMEYCWYDVIEKKYRKDNVYYYLQDFIVKLHEKRKNPVRRFSWRDASNKRLMDHARKCNSEPDGVYIYNMLYNIIKKDNPA